MTLLRQRIDARIADLTRDRTVERIWAGDHSVWKPEPTEIVDRLGWLRVANDLRHELPELEAFARAVVADGFKHVLLLGMGGSSLGPEVLRGTFWCRARHARPRRASIAPTRNKSARRRPGLISPARSSS
ncbi:MAG: hypothetical protein IPI85_14110 [Dehalococcoidia bacterium]|nr:hypothetical protein [Dehalococcoidia bacterium]